MGKKESTLIPFLIEGLERKKYGQDLTYVNENSKVFMIILPRPERINDDHVGCCNLLKDWEHIRNRKGKFDYGESKHRMIASLNKATTSGYLKLLKEVPFFSKTYQILSSDDRKKQKLKKTTCSPGCGPPSNQSGYSSNAESPAFDLADSEMEQLPEESSNEILLPSAESLGIIASTSYNAEKSCSVDYGPPSNESGYSSLAESPLPANNLTDSEREQSTEESPNEALLPCVDITDSEIVQFLEEYLGGDVEDGVENLGFIAGNCSNANQGHNVFAFFDGSTRNRDSLADVGNDENLKDLRIHMLNCNELIYKRYRFKSEQVLQEKTLMVCEPKDNIASREECYLYVFDSYGFAVDSDLSERIQNYQITSIYLEDNHLLLILCPRVKSLGAF